MTDWRFRTNLMGKLILQRCVGRDGPSEDWRDATVTDLLDFHRDIKQRGLATK